MKTSLLIACAALLLAGCSSTQNNTGNAGSPGFGYETDAGNARSLGYENNLGPNDPRGGFENWRFGGDPDRIAPREPVGPQTPAAPPFPLTEPAQP